VEAVVMAAGEGTRLRPLTERWPKPVLPIDGRAVIASLLRDVAAAGCERVCVVTGHLAGAVERLVGDGSGFRVRVRFVHQPGVLGSADAVRRALDSGVSLPVVVSAADTLYSPGDVSRFVAAFQSSRAAGAVAVRTDPPPGPGRGAVRRIDGHVERMSDDDPDSAWSAAPLWALGPEIAERLCLDNPPYELENAFQAAIDSGETVTAIEIGKTRDLTYPLDLVKENFSYLRAL
jgi:UDP-N-acetylglucosamine diphosphorylase / glucose-1-phosphate thymidylyltransferase / UDP-N-acetylgalactosamine diphosphorylase / glucosamine-1-phosphate N-acetyltransferase / galactosamine-1-phosphate N-acetyltransferase